LGGIERWRPELDAGVAWGVVSIQTIICSNIELTVSRGSGFVKGKLLKNAPERRVQMIFSSKYQTVGIAAAGRRSASLGENN
jgi:hypothetical protein